MTAPAALAALDAACAATARAVFAVPPEMSVSAWCDAHRMLSRESSAEAGPWRTERAPYQREVLDCIGSLDVPELVLMWSSQVGKTEVLLNAVAYLSACDPGPMLLVQPTIQDAESFSRERIAPMIRDTPALSRIYADPKARDSGNTLLQKQYVGGLLTLRGANSPSGLAGKPIRTVLFDEVDRAPASAGDEGDPVTLARRRSETFWNRQIITTSTPTTTGASRIEALYAASSQGQYWVPCPDCGAWQTLRWRDDDGTYRVTFARTDAGEVDEASVGYVCAHCASVWREAQKRAVLAAGAWRHAHPERRVRGYHLNALYSPWATWAHVVREFLAAKHSKETLRVFVNTMLGESFADEGTRVDPHVLATRAEPLRPLSLEVATLTAGVDVQADRLEGLLVGWGAGERAWVLERRQVWGDPQRDDVWAEMAAWLAAPVDGLRVECVAVDTGYQTDRVWRWIDQRPHGLGIIGVKGMPGPGRLILGKPAATSSRRLRAPWLVGVDTAKDAIAARLMVRLAEDGTAPPTYVRFDDGLDAAFYEGLTAEEQKTHYIGGRPVKKWSVIPGRANEPLDLFVYALAALYRRGARGVAALAPRASARRAPTPPETSAGAVPAGAPTVATVLGRSPRWMR